MKLKSLAETPKFTPTGHISFSFGTIQFVENYFSKLELYSLLSNLKKKGVDLAKRKRLIFSVMASLPRTLMYTITPHP